MGALTLDTHCLYTGETNTKSCGGWGMRPEFFLMTKKSVYLFLAHFLGFYTFRNIGNLIIFKLLVSIKHLETLECFVLETIDNKHIIPAAGLLTESGAALPLCELCPHRLSLAAKHRPAWVVSQSIG